MAFRLRLAKWQRFVLVGLLSLSFAYALLLCWVHMREAAIRTRSEALYSQFLRLQPGQTNKAEIEILRKQWGNSLPQEADCNGTDCEYTVGDVWGYSRWFLLTFLAHDHQPSSQLTLKTRGDLLSSASFSVGVWYPRDMALGKNASC
jgi:hypothetical protein